MKRLNKKIIAAFLSLVALTLFLQSCTTAQSPTAPGNITFKAMQQSMAVVN